MIQNAPYSVLFVGSCNIIFIGIGDNDVFT